MPMARIKLVLPTALVPYKRIPSRFLSFIPCPKLRPRLTSFATYNSVCWIFKITIRKILYWHWSIYISSIWIKSYWWIWCNNNWSRYLSYICYNIFWFISNFWKFIKIKLDLTQCYSRKLLCSINIRRSLILL